MSRLAYLRTIRKGELTLARVGRPYSGKSRRLRIGACGSCHSCALRTPDGDSTC